MKKYIIKYAVMACLSLGLTGTTASCTDYLDKAPESDVTPENAKLLMLPVCAAKTAA